MANKKSALGKGLSALLSAPSEEELSAEYTARPSAAVGGVFAIPVKSIEANPFQPRTEFEEEALQELAESIKNVGIIQPITVRKNGDTYQLISGERRLRASILAGLSEIPAYVRIANDQGMLEMAIVENIQRENLNPMEVAISYRRLMEECSLTQEQLAQRVAKKRSTVTNYMRLLKLPPEIQAGIIEEKISMGHARALVSIEDSKEQLKIYNRILHNGLSVRQVEDIVQKTRKKEADSGEEKVSDSSDNKVANFKLMGDKLSSILKHPIEIRQEKNGKGKILITFENEEDLEKIIEFFDRE